MKSLAQRIQRQNTVAVKILFRIEVRRVHFPYSGDLENESEVSVCFERGGKIATSADRPLFRILDGTMEVLYNETLSLVVTMYRDQNNQYQEKEGKLIIRQKKKMKKRGDYRGLGISVINLAQMCQTNQSTTLVLPVGQCSYPEATLTVNIMAKAIGECNEDVMSQDSGFSEPISDIAAEFEVNQLDRPRFPSSLPAYPPSYPPSPLPPTLRSSPHGDIPPSSISASNQFLALVSSNPELHKKWGEMEKDFLDLQQKYRTILQQKTELAETLFREREKNKKLEEDICLLKSSQESAGPSSDDRSVTSRLFLSVPDTPPTGPPPLAKKEKSTSFKSSETDEDFSLSRSSSADVSTPSLRSILKQDSQQSNSFKTPTRSPARDPAPVRSISTSRSVSFRNIRASSELLPSQSTDSPSLRSKTLPSSQLTDSLVEFNQKTPHSQGTTPTPTPTTPTPTLQTPPTPTVSRKQSMTGGPPTSLLLEENNKLQKEITKLKLFAQETDSLNKENHIEIQFLMEGKRRLVQENKILKERNEILSEKRNDLEKKLAESERRGRSKARVVVEDDDHEVRDEILLTKIQLELENSQLKENFEKLERDYLKLKRKCEEEGCGSGSGSACGSSSSLPLSRMNPTETHPSTQKEIQTLREIIRCRDLQISQLCLPQTASPFLHQLSASPQTYASPLSSPSKDENQFNETNRDSMHLNEELSQLIADSTLLSQAPPLPFSTTGAIAPASAADTGTASGTAATTTCVSLSLTPEMNETLLKDMNEVVSDLISSKLRIASLSTQLDVEVMKQQLLKLRLGKYATRVSQLEVENISLYSRINTLSSASQERRGSWYPSWLKRYLD